jgi:hypothetical protein
MSRRTSSAVECSFSVSFEALEKDNYLRKGMESMCAEASDQLMAAPAVSPMMYVPVCGVDSCLGYTHCIASVRTPSTNTPASTSISIT